MKSYQQALFVLGLAGMLAATGQSEEFVRPLGPRGMKGELPELRSSVTRLKQEITCLNLINALHLTSDQTRKILEVADRQKQIRSEYVSRVAGGGKEMEALLSELKGVLQKNNPIPDTLARKVHISEHRERRARNTHATQIAGNAKKLNTILTSAQLKVIETFKPCTIPPRDLSDPVRAGQASESGRGENMLRRIRETPTDVYRKRRDAIVDRQMSLAEEVHGRYTKSERSKEKKRILALLDRTRRMSDVDFELKKSELGQDLRPRHKIPELIAQLEKAKPGGGKGKAARFLLSPAAVSVLRTRAETLGDG